MSHGQIKKLSEKVPSFIYRVNEGCLIFERFEPYETENDLMLIESSLPQILAHALIKVFINKVFDFPNIIKQLEQDNPLQYDQSLGHKFYDYKLKNFLLSLALENMPAVTLHHKYDADKILAGSGFILVNNSHQNECTLHLKNKHRLFEMAFRMKLQ